VYYYCYYYLIYVVFIFITTFFSFTKALNATVAVQRTRTSQSESGLEAEPDVQDSRVSHASGVVAERWRDLTAHLKQIL